MSLDAHHMRAYRSVRSALVAAAIALLAGCDRGTRSAPAAAPDSTMSLRQELVALEAARSLADSGLVRATRHPDPRVRRTAVMGLGRIQDAAAVPALLPCLADSDTTVVEQTAWALRQVQGLDESQRSRVEFALMHELETQPNRRLWMFLEALRPHASAACFAEVSKWVAAGLFAGMGSEAREARLEGMAALTLANIDTPRAGALLGQLGSLQNRDPEAAWRIAEAMTVRIDSSYVASVLSLLGHRDPAARAAGARALAKYPGPQRATALFPLLADTDWRVRASALRALGDLGDSQARSYCASMSADSHALVREAALAALEKLGAGNDTRLVDDLRRDPVPAVRLAALRLLAASRAAAAAEAFAAARQDSVDFVRAEALGVAREALGDAAGATHLLEALTAGTPREQAEAALGLGDFAAELPGTLREATRAGLENALQGVDFVVATQAAEALGKLEMRDSAPALVAAFDRWQTGHNDADVRAAVLPALAAVAGKRPSAAVLDCLERAAQDADARVAQAAREALANVRGQDPPPAPPAGAHAAATLPATFPPIDLGPVRVRLVTASGVAILELDGNDTPRTVAHFLHLIDTGFYDDAVFHRVVPAFVVQGGCPRGDGWGDAGSFIPCEYGNRRYDSAGIVGMAHGGKDTGGSQFFITHLPVPRLDGRYTAFGRVVSGMDVVDRIVRGDRFRLERETPAAPTP